MLAYAADTWRGTIMTSAKIQRPTPHVAALLYLLLAAGVVNVAWNAWAVAHAPGQGLNYANLAWSVLVVASIISTLLRPAARVTALIFISATAAGMAVTLWSAAQAPEGWVNYFQAACLVLLLSAWWLAGRWARTRRA